MKDEDVCEVAKKYNFQVSSLPLCGRYLQPKRKGTDVQIPELI